MSHHHRHEPKNNLHKRVPDDVTTEGHTYSGHPCPPSPSPGSRRPRLPLTATFLHLLPQMCSVTCCLSRHGKEPKTGTMKHGLKGHAESHSSGQLTGQVPDACLADKALHICPVCPRLISTRTKSLTCCSRCSLTFHNSCPNAQERPLQAGPSNSTNPWPPRNRGRAASSPLSLLCFQTTTRNPGTTFYACRSWSSVPTRRKATTSRLPTMSRECASSGWRALAGPFGYHNALPTNGRARRRRPGAPRAPPLLDFERRGERAATPAQEGQLAQACCCSTSRQPH